MLWFRVVCGWFTVVVGVKMVTADPIVSLAKSVGRSVGVHL